MESGTVGGSRGPQERLHLAHGALDSDERGAGHDGVADVELLDLRDGDDGRDVDVGPTVARSGPAPQLVPRPRRVHHLVQLEGTELFAPGGGVLSGVDLDDARVDLGDRLDLVEIGVHENTDGEPALPEGPDDPLEVALIQDDVQASFGADLLP